ncbi:hypothetical protein ACSQ67_003853 [Phaseolus vulgaris]
MEIVRPQSRRNFLSSSNDAVSVPTIPLYRSAPSLEVRLEEFESFAIDRLRVDIRNLQAICVFFKYVELLSESSQGDFRWYVAGKKPEEMENLVKDLWKVNMRHQHASDVLNKDIVSHFVLRLVYCRTEDLRKWFLSMESSLFRHRFRVLNAEAQRAVMEEFNLPYRAVSNVEFEVPFEEVPELVAGRKVLISQGYAYVAMNQIVSLVATLFRSQLSKTLVLTNRKWTSSIREQEKHRLTPIVEALCSSYLGPDYSQSREYADISLKDIDQVAKNSFPLCMRHLFDKLKEDHHLKHGGRMQLGLFLKGVGLNLEDALAFWRAEFSKKVGLEKFEKQYAYSIRHNYGKEGKRTDYTPYSCSKIISSTPGTGDHHGCPYRHFRNQPSPSGRSTLEVGNARRNCWVGSLFYMILRVANVPRFISCGTRLAGIDFPRFGISTDPRKIEAMRNRLIPSNNYKDFWDCRWRTGVWGRGVDCTRDEENLRAALDRMGVNSRAMEDVLDKARNRHYQLACTLTFEALHGVPCDAGINHPNQYFSDSKKILQSKRDNVVKSFVYLQKQFNGRKELEF